MSQHPSDTPPPLAAGRVHCALGETALERTWLLSVYRDPTRRRREVLGSAIRTHLGIISSPTCKPPRSVH